MMLARTKKIRMLVAARPGYMKPVLLARIGPDSNLQPTVFLSGSDGACADLSAVPALRHQCRLRLVRRARPRSLAIARGQGRLPSPGLHHANTSRHKTIS